MSSGGRCQQLLLLRLTEIQRRVPLPAGKCWHSRRRQFLTIRALTPVLVERLLVIVLPAAGVVYPLARLLPSAYGWNTRNGILRMYGELKLLETEMENGGTGKNQDLLPRLDKLEERANHLNLPAFYMQSLYTLKDHIQLVRQRIEKQG